MKKSLLAAVFAAAFFAPFLAQSQTLIEWLERDSFLEISIQSDFSRLRKLKKEKGWQPARAAFKNEKGETENVEIEIRPGGVSRLEICAQPPMKILFPEKFLTEKGLSGPRRLHLVAPCQKGEKMEQLVLKEFMAYRLFARVTDRSLRANLLKIKLLDEKGAVESSSFAFFYEDAESLAARLGGRRVRPKVVRPEVLEAADFDLVALFQFMISNGDWHPHGLHNVHIFGFESAARPVAVPYDFDYSGFVDAPYAVPHAKLPVKNVTMRFYQGLCRDDQANERAVAHFLARKQAFFDEIEAFSPFSTATKKGCREYLEDFFAILEDPKKQRRDLFSDCGKWFDATK